MDAYPGYREPAPARSPTERTSWSGRDDGYRERGIDRADSFYRGRSPGMFISLSCLARLQHPTIQVYQYQHRLVVLLLQCT